MNRTQFCLIVSALVFGSLSADAARADDFKGFYAQPNAGGSFAHSGTSTTAAFSSAGHWAQTGITTTSAPKIKPTVSTGGGQAGYNVRSGRVVAGFELDLEETKLNDPRSSTALNPCCAPTIGTAANHTLQTDWLFTGRPRLGVTSGHWLVYGTGGAVLTNRVYQASLTDALATAHAGWAAGGGVQYQHAHILLRGEYLYAGFGNVSTTSANWTAFASPAPFPANVVQTANLKPQIIRGALGFRF